MSEGPIADSYGWSGSGDERQREASYTPDFASEIDGDAEHEETDFTLAAAIMRAVFEHAFSYRGDGTKPNLQRAFRRFVAIAWTIDPSWLAGCSLAELSAELSCTRALLSKISRDFSDRYGGLRNRMMRLESAREAYRAAQLKDHWRRREKKKSAVPCETADPMTNTKTPTPETSHD